MTWSNMLNGVDPNTDIAIEMCRMFECTLDQLVDPDHVLSEDALNRYLSGAGVRV